jgi:alkylation response protein AidB-like acyl-CoA dehydrogenase
MCDSPMSKYDDLYSPDELDWNQRARRFATGRLEPLSADIDQGGLCRDLMRELGAEGLLGTMLPVQYGGAGLTLAHNSLISEEISAVAPSLGAMRGVSDIFVGIPLAKYATEEQRRAWLPPMADGSASYSLGITEPAAGSDAAGIQTVARRDGGAYVLNGVKHYISGAAENDAALLYAATAPDAAPHHRFSAFLVPLYTPGITITPIQTTGLRGFSHARVEFEDAVVPTERMVGAEGQGFEILMYGLAPERVDIAARALGCARRSLEEATGHALTRRQFGQEISRFQGVSHLVADMRTWTEAARLLVLRASRLHDAGRPCEQQAAMAKLVATERGFAVCDGAMQIMGARGYTIGHAVDLMFRDIRALRFGGGTDQIMRHVIQREEFVALKRGSADGAPRS